MLLCKSCFTEVSFRGPNWQKSGIGWGNGLELNRAISISWWRHQMETFSALLAICAANSPVSGEFPAQRSVTRSFDIFFDLRLNKRLSKKSWGWWFETLSCPLWRQCNVKMLSYQYGDSLMKIRWSQAQIIFIIEIGIPRKVAFILRRDPGDKPLPEPIVA